MHCRHVCSYTCVEVNCFSWMALWAVEFCVTSVCPLFACWFLRLSWSKMSVLSVTQLRCLTCYFYLCINEVLACGLLFMALECTNMDDLVNVVSNIFVEILVHRTIKLRLLHFILPLNAFQLMKLLNKTFCFEGDGFLEKKKKTVKPRIFCPSSTAIVLLSLWTCGNNSLVFLKTATLWL